MHVYFSSMELLKINGCVFICKQIEKQKMRKSTRNKNQPVVFVEIWVEKYEYEMRYITHYSYRL